MSAHVKIRGFLLRAAFAFAIAGAAVAQESSSPAGDPSPAAEAQGPRPTAPSAPAPVPRVPRVVVEDHTVLESLALVTSRIPPWALFGIVLGVFLSVAWALRQPRWRDSAAAGDGVPAARTAVAPAQKANTIAPRVPGPASPRSLASPHAPSDARIASLAPSGGLIASRAPSGAQPAPCATSAMPPAVHAATVCANVAANPALAARLRERYLQVRFLGAVTREADLGDAALVAHAARRFLNDGLVDRAYELAELAASGHPGDTALAMVNLEISFLTGDAARFRRIADALGPIGNPVLVQVIRALGHRLSPGDPRFAPSVDECPAQSAFGGPASAGPAPGAPRPESRGEAARRLALDDELRSRLEALPAPTAARAAQEVA